MHHCADMPLSCSPHKRTMSIICAWLLHRWCTRALSHPYRRREYYPKTTFPFRSPHSIAELFSVPLPGKFVINIIRYTLLPFVLIICLVYSFDYKLLLLVLANLQKILLYKFVVSSSPLFPFRLSDSPFPIQLAVLTTESILVTVHLIDFDILLILFIQTKTEKQNHRKAD